MDTPANTQHSPQTAEGLPLEIAAAEQAEITATGADNNASLKQKEEQENQDDKNTDDAASLPADPDAVAVAEGEELAIESSGAATKSAEANTKTEQLDENGFARPRPVTDYLKDDDSLPGWLWTVGGVALIGGLDALDDDDSSDSNNPPTVNQAPRFDEEGPRELSVDEDNAVTFSVQASDDEGNELIFSNSTLQHGTISEGENDKEFIYTPDDDFFGEETFTLRVRDAANPLSNETLAFTITVNPINDAPEVDATQELGTRTGIALAFNVEADDIEDDTLSFSVADGDNAPQNGSVDAVNAGGNFTYTPNAGFIGEDSFQIIVSDGDKESIQTVTINVRGAQTVSADDVSVYEGAANTTAMVFTLNFDSAATEDIVLNVSKSGGNASASSDFSAETDTVTLAAGETSVDFVIDVIGDTANEGDETLELTFDSLQLAAPITVTGTIINDDPDTTVTLSAADDSGAANNDGLTQTQALTLIVTSATGADVEIFSGGQSLGMATEDTENPGTYSFLTADLDEGSYQFMAIASIEGSQPASSLPLSVTVDLSSPTLTEFNANADDDTVTLTFSEAVDFLDATGITFSQDDNSIAAVLDSIDGNTATFSFEADLVSGSLIDVAIADNSVADLAGNLLTGFDFMDDPNAITV